MLIQSNDNTVKRGLGVISILFSLIISWCSASAEEVKIEFNGLDLLGNLELADGKKLETDGVAIIVHGTLTHGQTPFITDMQQGLAFQGVNTLAITLSLGIDARNGNFDCSLEQNHRHKDGAEEINAWVKWLSDKGVQKVSLVGIERGGNQASLFLHEQLENQKKQLEEEKKRRKKKKRRRRKTYREPLYLHIVNKLVLVSPINLTSEQVYHNFSNRHKADLGGYLVEAQQHVEALNEQELMEGKPFLSCNNTRVTAAAFVDYYLPKDKHSVLKVAPDMPFPILAIFGNDDPQYRKYENIVSDQLEKGEGQMGVAIIDRPANALTDSQAPAMIKQIAEFLKR